MNRHALQFTGVPHILSARYAVIFSSTSQTQMATFAYRQLRFLHGVHPHLYSDTDFYDSD